MASANQACGTNLDRRNCVRLSRPSHQASRLAILRGPGIECCLSVRMDGAAGGHQKGRLDLHTTEKCRSNAGVLRAGSEQFDWIIARFPRVLAGSANSPSGHCMLYVPKRTSIRRAISPVWLRQAGVDPSVLRISEGLRSRNSVMRDECRR
ncbi:hypothetical protein MPH_10452 [Macrophomina phaseolina MS6]|uniref:Uncharacterized protein n=1 Tax=Macrophomina phaseolina (strain MS6) TaxID=1126212 RepID=K2S6E0_MACPH|nr:hypothetical protein MPH_10452 [Macrophomina phaseolina MS6]